MHNPLVSVVIDNYNYGRFLAAAIESALNQTYSDIEIVVVDDGSTDDSRSVIEKYRGRVIPILKRNGGQASALNAGVARATGNIICFLDSDDVWYPDKISRVVTCFRGMPSERPILIHHFLEIFDESVRKTTGRFMGNSHASPCNLYEDARRHRYIPYIAGPTSSISINRSLASALFPLPERRISISADDFVVFPASLIGEVQSIDCTLGQYRVHDSNGWFTSSRTKAPEFVEALDAFMNQKLIQSGRDPCISFYDSMYLWKDLANGKRWGHLFISMLKLTGRQRDALTLKFVYETIKQIFDRTPLRRFSIFRRIVAITRPVRVRLLGW